MRPIAKRAGLVVTAIAMTAAMAACNSSTPTAGNHPSSGKSTGVNAVGASTSYIKQAALTACPTTTAAAPVSGGLPSLTLPCLGNGPSVNLADLRGKPMVVNLWAQWCTECGKEAPDLSTVAAEEPSVRFIGVDTLETEVDGALAFDANTKPAIHYPSVVDKPGTLLHTYLKRDVLPATLLVSPTGKVVDVIGFIQSAAQLRADIAHYLGVKS